MALAHLADQELAATGVRRRRRTLVSGDAALTPSERRVACLAADGLSNPDIARALSITRKTVEMHLGNAYRKLQIGSRRQLVIALGLEPERAGL
jgi:DNA-binding CsgD family transcriptional regulator